MADRKQKQVSASLRKAQPKKLGLSVPPLLRLPHEDLIRPEGERTDQRGSEDSAAPPQPQLNKEASTKGAKTSPANSARLADLEGANRASLAKSDALGWQIASLANSASQAISAGLVNRVEGVSLMDSLPESVGFTKLHHQLVDHLYPQLSPKEQVVHLQLYRLSWGKGRPNCFMSLPKLARRANLSQRSVGEAVALLEHKRLIRKGSVVTGRGKEQGIEYWVVPAPVLAKPASLANPASLAGAASLAKSGLRIEYKEEIHEEHTHKEGDRVGVGSRFSLEDCRRFADHLQRTGQGINNAGGFATAIHRTGEADTLIESFIESERAREQRRACPDCNGEGFKIVERDGREGVVRCNHDRLHSSSGKGSPD